MCPAEAPPPPGRTTTVYVFLYHSEGEMVASFYAIDITNTAISPKESLPSEEEVIREPLCPILVFPEEEFPLHMCCVRYGSMFYFLGGKRLSRYCAEEDDAFPPNVYIFDPASPSALKSGVPMNSGKDDPCSFVADGMLYVIGNTPCGSYQSKALTYFEVFDFSINKWIPLPPPPPITRPAIWSSCDVVDRNVFVYGFDPCKERFTRTIFNLDSRSWDRPSRIDEPDTSRELHLDTDTELLAEGSTGAECSYFTCWLGNGLWCYAVSGSHFIRYDPWLYECVVDRHTRYLKISILEEHQETSTAKFMHTSDYVITTSFISVGLIHACYVLRPEDKKKRRKKRRKNKNMQSTKLDKKSAHEERRRPIFKEKSSRIVPNLKTCKKDHVSGLLQKSGCGKRCAKAKKRKSG